MMKKKDRQISTMFFERTFASKNKKAMLEKGRVPESGDLLTAEVKLIFFAFFLLSVINFCSRLPNGLSAPEQAGSLSYGEPTRKAAEGGREFLVNLVHPDLNLLPEFKGHNVVWLYHDNYLAAKVLTKTHPTVAAKITAAIRKYGVTRSGKIELLFGEASLPLRRYELRDVAKEGAFTIRSEFTTDALNNDFANYADLLCFAAIAEEDIVIARSHLDEAYAMWDGIGFQDQASRKVKIYATYKLALYLLAARRFEHDATILKPIQQRLLSMQAESGGWITDYKADKSPVGFANVETTSLAILALETANAHHSR